MMLNFFDKDLLESETLKNNEIVRKKKKILNFIVNKLVDPFLLRVNKKIFDLLTSLKKKIPLKFEGRKK
ncbi:hypothetical protein C1646_691521 [Rhizophagus diaphanus]|nr:hypothetical protein C1646_691521 [Rhizophagus diaphanus] [Rhizophagus sp. MUCL 43196]